ncbi:MAG: hypothetical protein ACRDHP_01980 [Ktedonobacterales bacterium]
MMLIEKNEGQQIRVPAGQHDEWARRCDRAAELLDAQPDEAAMLLDGLLQRIACEWAQSLRARQAAPLPAEAPEQNLLALIEDAAPPVGWRLRLALRAPDVRARLVACRSLVEALDACAPSRP